jgi:hypothetical protein
MSNFAVSGDASTSTEEEIGKLGPLSPILMISTTLYLISSIFTYIEFHSTNNPNATAANKDSLHAEYDSRGRRGGVRRNPIKQRGDSPVELREQGSPHTRPDPKANGEINRRLFYRYLLFAQLVRAACLPLGYVFVEKYQITSIVAQTLPTLSSALAYSVLVIFYAQVTMTASGGGIAFDLIQMSVVRGAYSLYAILVGLNCVIPLLSEKNLFLILCGGLSFAFLFLFISMTYFGLKMVHLLRSTVTKMLGCRLVGMSTICCIAFILRSIILGWEVYSGVCKAGTLIPSLPFWKDDLGRTTAGYLILEWTPDVAILFLMHRKKASPPEIQDQAVNLEAGNGQMSPLSDQQTPGQMQHHQHDGKKGEISINAGFSRSHSANGGVAVPSVRPTFSQQGQQRMISNSGHNLTTTSRSVSGGRPETVSLLGDKSQSAVVSATNLSSLYGAVNPLL